jgi:hypothetical protein
LENADVEQAATDADATSDLFRELAAQLEAVAADELARRVAAARDLSSSFAMDMRQFDGQLRQRHADDADSSAEVDGVFELDDLVQQLVRQADRLDTIADVLQSIEATFGADGSNATIRIARLQSEYELTREIELLLRAEQQIVSSSWPEAAASTAGVADRIDVLSQRLDAIHRDLVAPRLEQLLALEKRASQLLAELSDLSSDSGVTRWHEKTDALLDDIASAELQFDSVAALREAMDAKGWRGTPPDRWDWPVGIDADALSAPEPYLESLEALVLDLQSYIRMLALAGAYAADTDAVPPQYVDFVRRYLEVLSQDVAD